MTDSVNEMAHYSDEPLDVAGATLKDYLSRHLVVADLQVTSKKRLLEKFAGLIANSQDGGTGNDESCPAPELIFDTLYNRERLGCTALGAGVALPHGRVAGLARPIISIARLAQPVDYDAPDGMPVWLAACLVIPENAHDEHLQLLALLAGKFSDEQFMDDLGKARSAQDLYHCLIAAR